jgi:hypothetical protein
VNIFFNFRTFIFSNKVGGHISMIQLIFTSYLILQTKYQYNRGTFFLITVFIIAVIKKILYNAFKENQIELQK